jgi:alkanesulfonate monooxygenase SsuD/methylene tetrahydromethanopterin reductase-like flavin-dependent oxidoreductase (luciferase family)
MTSSVVGLVIGSDMPPERLGPVARAAEGHGFGELWLSEDLFLTGGISGAAIVLAATSTVPVGIGVVSAVTRHPAVLAMEIATLARAFPGRLLPAVGLGVPTWLDQLQLAPKSGLGAVRDCVIALRRLLDGEEVTASYPTFTYDRVQLAYPVTDPLPIRLGVAGPKMLQLSGAVADGTLLSVLAGTDYVRWARQQIERGARDAGVAERPHEVTAFALCSVDRDGDRARTRIRPAVAFYLAAGGPNALTESYGISDRLRELISAGGVAAVEREMPDAWVDDLAVAGTPGEVLARIESLRASGADRVALYPTPTDTADHTIAMVAEHVLPHLTASSHPA